MVSSVILSGAKRKANAGSGKMKNFMSDQAAKQRAKKEKIEKKKAEQKEEKKSGD